MTQKYFIQCNNKIVNRSNHTLTGKHITEDIYYFVDPVEDFLRSKNNNIFKHWTIGNNIDVPVNVLKSHKCSVIRYDTDLIFQSRMMLITQIE